MNSKLIMTASAVILGICGILLSFLPQEILLYLHQIVSTQNTLVLQLLGALYMSMGIMNWMSRGNLIGGIYSRPLAFANTLHFAVGALTLLKSVFKEGNSHLIINVMSIIYTLFAIGFITVIFTTPRKVAEQKSET